MTLDEATVFDVFDTHISLVNGLRRSLRTDLDDARASLREAGQVNLSTMLWQTRALDKEWDDFHVEFDQLAPDQRRVRLKTGAGRPGLTGRRFRSDRKGH